MEVSPPPAACWSNVVKSDPRRPPPQPPTNAAVEISRVVGSCKSSKGVSIAVVDANAIIRGGERLHTAAEKFVSVSEVLREVRDPVARHRLAFLPFSVDTLEPSPESLDRVIRFAKATGDLQTLSDVDLKLIALTYTLEAQIHGTERLRDTPPPIHAVKVKRLPEKDMPGWGSNVPNLEEWEALEHLVEDSSNTNSRILPLKDISPSVAPVDDHPSSEDNLMDNEVETDAGDKGESSSNLGKPRWYTKKEINVVGKKMVASGVDASKGECNSDSGDWLPAVSRSTHRRFLKRKARREMYEASERDNGHDEEENMESTNPEETIYEGQLHATSEEKDVANGISQERLVESGENSDGDLSSKLKEMRLEEDLVRPAQAGQCIPLDAVNPSDSVVIEGPFDDNANIADGSYEANSLDDGLDQLEVASERSECVDASYVDDSSEQSWNLRSLSDSTVACVTSDFAMQNVILQMGLRLLAPDGMQIRQLHRWILRCHACFTVTTEIGRIFCPKCGNGGTLRKLSVTVGENGIVQSSRRPNVSLRGTRFSLPLPQGGRDAVTKNPVLREDQLPHKVLYPRTKKKLNKEGDEIFTPDDIFCHHSDKKAPLRPPVGRAVSIFFGKRNPNDNHFSRSKGR